jgi:hypothetical protein
MRLNHFDAAFSNPSADKGSGDGDRKSSPEII